MRLKKRQKVQDPTPIEEQQEIVRAGRDGPLLKIKGEDHESRIFDRTHLKRAGEDSSKALSDEPTSVQPPQILDQAGATPLAINDTIPPSFRFSKRRTEFDSKVLNIVDVKSTTRTFAISEPQQRLISVDAGTSFVVVNHLKGRSERDSPLFEAGNSP